MKYNIELPLGQINRVNFYNDYIFNIYLKSHNILGHYLCTVEFTHSFFKDFFFFFKSSQYLVEQSMNRISNNG